MKRKLTPLLLLLPVLAAAQDMNYWTNQFGTRSALMGGAVVGGIKDNTAVYYNPAALAFIDSASVSASANIYRLENIKLTNAVGEGKNFSSLNLGSIPLLVRRTGESKKSQPENRVWPGGANFFLL